MQVVRDRMNLTLQFVYKKYNLVLISSVRGYIEAKKKPDQKLTLTFRAIRSYL